MKKEIIDFRRRLKAVPTFNDFLLKINGLISFYEKNNNKKPIFICTSARTGSTWLMQLIASAKRMRFVNQPLDLINFHTNKYGMEPSWKFLYGSENRKEILKEYIDDLIEGKITLEFPHQFWDPTYDITVNRLVFKTVFALDLIEWFEKTFRAHIIYLVRHPVPTVLSRIKYDWHLGYTKYILENKANLGVFPNHIHDFAQEILKKGTKLEKYSLQWCLENFFPLKNYDSKNRLNITYEELVLEPEKLLSLFINRLNLNDSDYDRMRKMVVKRARSPMTHDKTKKFLEEANIQDDRSYLIRKWKKEINPRQKNKIFNIIENFNIGMYSKNSFMPSNKYMNFRFRK